MYLGVFLSSIFLNYYFLFHWEVRLYFRIEYIVSVAEVKRHVNTKRSLRTEHTRKGDKCYSVYLCKRGERVFRVQLLQYVCLHGNLWCQYVCTYHTSCCSRRTRPLAQWHLKYKELGACLRSTDVAKYFWKTFMCVSCRGSRVSAVLWGPCRQCSFWTCQNIMYPARISSW